MDVESRQNKVDGLEAIKNKALDMAAQGKDSLEVRDFVTNAKKELAFEIPDEEAFGKAAKAANKFKKNKEK
mgnify:FL=1|tara:strand:- start:65 stop:277 length:213 start_codon:yes stop_codon:yes gene_type:complete